MELRQGLSLSTDYPKFTECDRCVFSLLHICLTKTVEPNLEGSQIQQIFRQLKHSLDEEGAFYVTHTGEVQFMAQWVIELLNLLLLREKERLFFSITALELLGLTKREAEVLFWVAKDKSNAEISKTLGCREGTVRKHLEHLYEKLNVQTRTGAVIIALERLGLLQS